MKPTLIVLFLLAAPLLYAQNNTDNICEDNDCPTALFDISIDQPTQTTTYSKARTERIQQAYLQFEQIKTTYANKATWQVKRNASQVGGKSCIRHYQLESFFANEYIKNADFKTFIDQNGVISNYVEQGFESSRKGLNLQRRMELQCRGEVRKVTKQTGLKLAELPVAYMQLGQQLGYFDNEGNPTSAFVQKEKERQAVEQMTDNQQIAALKDQVAQLIDQNVALQTIDRTATQLKTASTKANKLVSFLEDVIPIVDAFVPVPLGLITKLGKVGNLLDKAQNLPDTGLLGKLKNLTQKGKDLLSRGQRVKKQFDNLASKAKKTQNNIQNRQATVEGLKDQMNDLVTQKQSLQEKLSKNPKKILKTLKSEVTAAANRAAQFQDDLSQEEQKAADLLQQIEALEATKNQLQQEFEALQQDTETLDTETTAIETEAQAATTRPTLAQKEAAIKAEYGNEDVQLNPVSIEEWSENFEVERQYWDAVFHPDDEVVEGYRGRYFQVRLKDADKNVKLLFGPGEYFMKKSDFRDQYGSVIGAFVTEALHTLKQTDQQKIKVFIQGSADLAGQSTFSGQLDDNYVYSAVDVLPYNTDTDRFGAKATQKTISKTRFTNSDLPNLRGQFLKDMIRVYSKKIDPILLEGTVKKVVEEGERNAVIYLFVPEELLKE
ncbi:MAG: hypothetical protein AAGI23_01770 [Bacteroidota bacterium]